MNISVIGTGYVGLVTGACFADLGNDVTCIDINQEKINLLNEGISPIYEPGLEDILKRNIKSNRLKFSVSKESIKNSSIIFLCVNTPMDEDGSANLEYLFKATHECLEYLQESSVLVVKSTVPVGTNKKIEEIISKSNLKNIYVVSNPEFLKEGAAVNDFMRPDRIIIGHRDQNSKEIMKELYRPFMRQGNPILFMKNESSELTKYACNVFLATKISFVNEMSRLCDAIDADIEEIRSGLGSDPRIGKHFLYPGPGYGGSCFPKDVSALIHLANSQNIELDIPKAAEVANTKQKNYLIEKLQKYFAGDFKDKTFSIWGLTFKAHTDDVRESAAFFMVKFLLDSGAKVNAYDPMGTKNFVFSLEKKYQELIDKKLFFKTNRDDCLEKSSALIILTEWREFQSLNIDKIKSQMYEPVIFDGRNLFNGNNLIKNGLKYFAIGKSDVSKRL